MFEIVIFDLEYNTECKLSEIIEVGTFSLCINTGTYTIERETNFHSYIKPTYHPILSNRTIQMTGITQDKVDSADKFDNVYNELVRRYSDNKLYICWGDRDLKVIHENVTAHNACVYIIDKQNTINLQGIYSAVYGKAMSKKLHEAYTICYPKKRAENTAHNAVDDAKMTCEIFKSMVCSKIHNDKILPFIKGTQLNNNLKNHLTKFCK